MILSCVFIPFGKTKEKDEGTQERAGTGEERALSFFPSPSVCDVKGKEAEDGSSGNQGR